MSNVRELYPGRNFSMRIDVERGPRLVVRFDDGWEYPLDITREQAVYFAGLLWTLRSTETTMPDITPQQTEAGVPQLPSGIYPGRTGYYSPFTTSLIFIAEDGGPGVEYRLTQEEAILLARWLLKQATANSPAAGSA